ncbi:MAG TPA: GDSL-type esterase/lipase family protein, partial [Longimicrobiales bacterium]|nr:GDSL-type esterase/lipase family protein [Longimicrobiales bacterium]
MLRNSRLLVLALVMACGEGERAAPALPPGTDTTSAAAPAPTREPAAGSPDAAAPRQAPSRDRIVAVFMGTSLTAGLGLLRDEDRYSDRLQALADSAGLPVEIVNAGVSGETSAGGLRRIDWVLRRPIDVLVIELGANDGLRGLDPAALERNLREIVR